MSFFLRRFVVVSFVLMSGCGGSSSAIAPLQAPGAAQRGANVSLAITWPARPKTAAGQRSRAYVSAFTQSLTISVGGKSLGSYDNPTTSGSPPVTQSFDVVAPPGSQTFLIALYDATGGTGNLLARSSTTQTIALDTANMLKITVDGYLAKIGISPVPNPYLETTPTGANYTLVGPLAQTFALVPEDKDGGIIVSPGKIPPLTLSSGSSSIVATAVAGATNTYTIGGPAPTTAAVTLTASGVNLDNGSVTSTFTAQILAALFVTDPVAHRVAVLDDRGNALTMPTSAFPDISDTRNCGPLGIAYVAPTSASPAPRLFVTRCVGQPLGNIGEFDLLGNELTPSTPFSSNMPQQIGYDPGSGGRLLVPDTSNVASDPTIEFFSLDGTLLSSNPGPFGASRTFAQANSPFNIAIDPSLSSPYYMISDGTGYLQKYNNDGSFNARVAAGDRPGGITYDPNNKYFYITTHGSVAPQNAPVAERGTVYAFDLNLVQQTTGTANALAFMGLSIAPTDVLFDPYNSVLYVADYAGNKIVTFKEDGSSSTQFASAVTSVVDPEALALAP